MLEKCPPLAKGPYYWGEDNNFKVCLECVEICHVKFNVITRKITSCRSTGSLKKTWKSNLVS